LKASSEVNNSFYELKVALEKIWEWDSFPVSAGPINKAAQNFKKRLREYVKAGGEHLL